MKITLRSCVNQFTLWLQEAYNTNQYITTQICGPFGVFRDYYEIENIQIEKDNINVVSGNKVIEIDLDTKEVIYDEIEEEYILLYEGLELSFSRI